MTIGLNKHITAEESTSIQWVKEMVGVTMGCKGKMLLPVHVFEVKHAERKFKVKRNSFRRSNYFGFISSFHFFHPTQSESTPEGNNLVLLEQILSFRVHPFWSDFAVRRSKQELSSFEIKDQQPCLKRLCILPKQS